MNRGNKNKMGQGGFCICPKCNQKISHERGIPCQTQRCPHCDTKLVREGSYHHELIQKKKSKELGV